MVTQDACSLISGRIERDLEAIQRLKAFAFLTVVDNGKVARWRGVTAQHHLLRVPWPASSLRAGEAGAGRSPRRQLLRRVQRGRGAYTPGALTNMWHRLTKAAGVRPIRLHDARHTCGTALHLRGVPMAVIAKWLGHADASITARIYAHSQDDALRAAGVTLGQVPTPGG